MNMPASPYIVVIGSLNTDIGGHTSVPFKRADSNPGRITKTYGGTGHNIACNISLMGFPVKFITAFGDESDELRDHCADMGLDVSESLTVPGGQSSTYLYIDDSNGEMIAAVSDMEIYSEITVDFIKDKMDVLNGALVVVFDTNIPQETIEYIAENCTRPLVCDPVSTSKAKKLKNCLGHIAALKPNRVEAEAITGIRIPNGAAAYEAVDYLIRAGVKRVFLTLGEYGVVCADSSGRNVVDTFISNPVDVTGSGDAFCAAVAIAMCGNIPTYTIGCLGSSAAAITAEVSGSINPALSAEKMREYMKNI